MSRTLQTLAALALVAFIVAGCSTAPVGTDTGSGATSIDSATQAPSSNAPAGTSTGSSGGNTTAPTAATGSGTGNDAVNTAPATAPDSTGSSGGNTTTATREQAVKFAECMRKNGVSKFPDPDASGQLTIDQIANGTSLDTNTAAFKQAIGTCKDLEPAGFTGGQRSPEQQKAALAFAQCVRDNGVKDFPDPAPDAPLVDTNRIPSSARNGGMSMLNAAMHKCGALAANAGVTGASDADQ